MSTLPLSVLTRQGDIRTPDWSTMSDQHRDLQGWLQSLGAKKKLFRKAVEQAVGERFVDAPRIIPDAYAVNADEKHVLFLEVCISRMPGWAKLDKVAAWFRWLKDRGWSARLLYVTETGIVGIDPEGGGLDAEHMAALDKHLKGGR